MEAVDKGDVGRRGERDVESRRVPLKEGARGTRLVRARKRVVLRHGLRADAPVFRLA